MMVMNNAHDLTPHHNVSVGQGVPLEPFLHQVAGRSTMMCLNETTVCKPLNYREDFFYKSLPPDILQFTPQFKGIVDVNIEETPDGNITLTAYPNEAESDSDNSSLQDLNKFKEETNDKPSTAKEAVSTRPISHTSCKRIRLKRTGSLCLDSVVGDDDCSGDLSSSLVNPWISKVYKEGLKRHLRSSNKAVKKCILLENVASQFRRPCVLDLKMGTRVHGDQDDDEKKQRKKRKCASSTTQEFGFRISGMQIFNSNSGKFLCRDKYYGRKLDAAGLRSTLHQFFHDGRQVRRELIVPVLSRLRSIRAILEQLRSFRFYASSLLIMYDGDVKCCCLDVPLSPSMSHHSEEDSDADRSEHSSDSETKNRPESGQLCVSPAACHEPCSQSSASVSDTKNPNSAPVELRADLDRSRVNSNQVHVDIRMIDFAKATHQNMEGSTVVHHGPDHGYIFGLTNLISILQDFLDRTDSYQDDHEAKLSSAQVT